LNVAQKKRVLLVSPIGESGGAEQVFLKLAQCLPDYNYEPVLACMRPGPLVDRAKQQGLEVHAFQEHRMRQVLDVVKGVQWLKNLIRQVGAEIVHANYTAHLYASPASRLAGVPEIWHIHDYPYRPDSIDFLQARLSTAHVIFTTERVKSGFPHLCSRHVSVVPPTCIDSIYLDSLPQTHDIRKVYHLPTGPLFLTVARLQSHKGHEFLIGAIPAILKQYPDAVFAIVGKAGNAEQRLYQQKLQALCHKFGVEKAVNFLGYVGEQDLVSLFREATALVHPAISEGFGLTLLEAMALGVPVVASAADGPKELIIHRNNGLLVPVSDSSALAEAVIEVATDQNLAASLRREGKSFAARKSLRSMVEQTVKIYQVVDRATHLTQVGTKPATD